MSEEDYYIDILKEEDEDPKKPEEDYSWGSEPSYKEEPQPDYYQQDYEDEPYQQEFYGEGYYQDYQEPRRQRSPPRHMMDERSKKWFWLGVLIAVGVSAIIMVIFNFIGTAYHPGLAYVEMVLLLACCTLPGLFVRKVGKGILGGMLIFGLQFFLPIALFYGLGKDPTSFFSPYYLFLNSVGLILNGYTDLKTMSIIPIDPLIYDNIDQYTGYASFVWVFDMLIMFGIMITLVIASSWLFSNLFTDKAKNFWTWCLLPGQAIFIIINLFVVPWLLLSLTATVQTGGALAAGAANVAEAATPFLSGNFTDLTDADFNAMLERLDAADLWFEIARGNYDGLSSLRFFRLLQAVSGNYAFTVTMFNATLTAGFELLQAISPLAHGVFDNVTTTPGAQVDGFYYQYQKFMKMYQEFPTTFDFSGNGTKPSEADLAEMEADVDEIIEDIDLILDLHFGEVLEHILIAQEILLTIDPDDLRNVNGIEQVDNVLVQVADQLDMVMNISNEYSVLIPIAVDLLFESPNLLQGMFDLLIGNIRLLLGYQFEECQEYFTNATTELGYVDAIFTPSRRSEIILSGSSSALGFFDFFDDIIDLALPIIDLEKYMAATLGGIVDALDTYYYDGTYIYFKQTTPSDWNEMWAYMADAIAASDNAVANATEATAMLNTIEIRGNNSEYSLMSGIAYQLTSTINSVFQPEPFALILSNISRAINATYATTYYIYTDDSDGVSASLYIASSNLNNTVDIVEAYNDTPVYALRDFLVQFQNSTNMIKNTIDPYLGMGPFPSSIKAQVEAIIATLRTQIHVIVDDGLPAT
ncbi:MAG: hypothetical protein FK731_01975 [Asgard group archaeon]|nr:hypothetical protein [Asgard group archaeon]